MESSIDIHFQELDALLSPWREATVEVATKGVPPHITLLYPWKPPPIEAADIRALEGALADVRRFTLTFAETRTFPSGVIYLGLEDESIPRSIAGALSTAFPEYPPYGGAFPDPVPHLTIAKVDPERMARTHAEIDAALRDRLPLRVAVDEIVLMIEDNDGWWTVRHRHALA
jgi:2'-5' RNA ligase